MPGAKPYAVVGGRSNARWWLIPLENGRVAASGLALFQPLLVSARMLKAAASALSLLGLVRLWTRNMVYVVGEPNLARHFQSTEPLTYAYFTGTDSPHRKVAVQIMDDRGRLKGFAKLTRNPQVRTLLAHEAATLERVRTLELQTAYVPKVLFYGEQGDSTLLVTDTLKTSRTPSTTQFTPSHLAFVLELAQKTTDQHKDSASKQAAEFRARFNLIRSQVDRAWEKRLDDALKALEALTDLSVPTSLSHGDFTPWNTFLSNDRLYVFDWEYAENGRPLSNDIIHFILNETKIRSQPANEKLEVAMACLTRHWTDIQKETVPSLLLIYLLTQTLRQIERPPSTNQRSRTWDGAQETGALIDAVILSFPSHKMEVN